MTGARMAGDVLKLRAEVHAAESMWQRLKEDLGLATDAISVVGPDVTRPTDISPGWLLGLIFS